MGKTSRVGRALGDSPIVSRATFFLMIAVALRYYGDDIRIFIEKHLPMAALSLLVIVVGGFFVLPMVL